MNVPTGTLWTPKFLVLLAARMQRSCECCVGSCLLMRNWLCSVCCKGTLLKCSLVLTMKEVVMLLVLIRKKSIANIFLALEIPQPDYLHNILSPTIVNEEFS